VTVIFVLANGDTLMEMVSSYCHLGHFVTSNLDDTPDIINRQSSFIGQVNSVLCSFGKLSSDVKIRSFRSYCTSLYGRELWNLMAELCTNWRKSVRRFLPCDALHCTVPVIVILSVRLSVRPSVTLVDCVCVY